MKSMRKNTNSRLCFKDRWNKIAFMSKNNKNINILNETKADSYFDDVPIQQEMLIQCKELITKEKIDFSNYVQLSNQIMKRSIYECFHGILFYIFFYSKNKFNTEEIEIHFSGANNCYLLSKLKNINILNIFDYENINTKIDIPCYINSFFGVTFKNIKIKPVSYALRSPVFSSQFPHLVSFTFEGFDDINKQWDVLDEQVNISVLVPNGGYNIFYNKTTNKCYSSFIIKQTSPGNNGMWGFSLAAFEIHGIIYYKENIEMFTFNSNDETNPLDFDFNPTFDLSQFLI